MHPEQYAKSRAAALDCAIGTAAGIGPTIAGKGADLPALEVIANRIQNLASRLDDTNRYTIAFVERVSGAEPAKPDSVNHVRDGGHIMPALAAIDNLLNMLEHHVHTAGMLSHKLARIA